jgi:Protein of unknown function (DUF1592)/Protein of unknown function (DUF1588)/Protein of unknown function (DUF1595)/Protein of unknown function (DUF1587)
VSNRFTLPPGVAVYAVSAWLAFGMGCTGDVSALPPPWTGQASSDYPSTELLIPARIRRLSNAEYNGSVAALLGTQLTPGSSFAPDARQAGFTVNEAQRVDAVLARQLFTAAQQLAADARARFGELAPCATPGDPEVCARAFIASFGARAYRRPLVADEAAGLLDVYRAGALDAAYEDGVELVIRALLQSAGFLYLTELGAQPAPTGSAVALTGYELASSLSYLLTGAPPDQALLDAAATGELDAPEARRSQLQRLRLEHPESRDQLVRTLREWLELDRIEFTAKDIAFYPTYEQLEAPFITESQAFIGAVLDADATLTSNVSTLLAADWTLGDMTLAQFYDAQDLGNGRLQLTTRRGILNQGAFLAVHSHAYESSPVLRGAVIARRLACIAVPEPGALGISVSAPPSDPTLTTRQRFDAHVSDPVCAQCHKTIDGFGNAFEQYDGMGALRQTENGAAVDSTTQVAVGADFDGAYADSNALAEALAASPTVHECFARYLFRAASARSIDSGGMSDTSGSEDAFIAQWRALPEIERGNVVDTLSAFVSSRLFTHRKAL